MIFAAGGGCTLFWPQNLTTFLVINVLIIQKLYKIPPRAHTLNKNVSSRAVHF